MMTAGGWAYAESPMLAELVECDFLVPTGEPGLFGHGQHMLAALDAIQRAVIAAWGDDDHRVMEFPAVMARSTLAQAGYIVSFPHLVGSVDTLPPESSGEGAWEELLTASAYVLAPASCYPVYPLYAGPLPAGGASVRVTGRCFRHEPSTDPERLVAFRQLEFVRIASADETVDWFERGRAAMPRIADLLGLDAHVHSASDPFFGPARRVLSAMQINDGSKFELCARVADHEDVAVASANHHVRHLTQKFGITDAAGEPVTSACVAFGLERLVYAVVTRHGHKLHHWPDQLRAYL